MGTVADQGHVIVIGAGVGGLSAAAVLAAQGWQVTVLERAQRFGGKMREEQVAERTLDAGPTVLTMRPVLEELFRRAGARLDEHVVLRQASVLARHNWSDGTWFDLHADPERTTADIAEIFGAAESDGFRRFRAHIRKTWETVEVPFLRSQRPGFLAAAAMWGRMGPGAVWSIDAHRTMWSAISSFFRDPRLRQLFARYATYVGSSPFQAPATLNLIAHVEQDGVWLVEGGMYRLAVALAGLVFSRGGVIRCGVGVREIRVERGRVSGVVLEDGSALAADAVISGASAEAIAAGAFGAEPRGAVPAPSQKRSLSALTMAAVGTVSGPALSRHTVLFSDDTAAEFGDLFAGRLPRDPTVYICAQDRTCEGALSTPDGRERLFFIINAPARGDDPTDNPGEVEACLFNLGTRLNRCGIEADIWPQDAVVTTPRDFERRFPSTGGALYGPPSHGWAASFQRSGARTNLPGLYLAGGSAHPGAGVPMVALSGMLASEALVADLASTPRSRPMVTAGGISTR